MNTIKVDQIVNKAILMSAHNTLDIRLIDVETVGYGFAGLQSYEGVEPIGSDD